MVFGLTIYQSVAAIVFIEICIIVGTLVSFDQIGETFIRFVLPFSVFSFLKIVEYKPRT